MFVFTGHRGPGRCRRSKNKSSTDFWSFVWRISPQHFWHISMFACFCSTKLASAHPQRCFSSSPPHQPKTQESCLHSFALGWCRSQISFLWEIFFWAVWDRVQSGIHTRRALSRPTFPPLHLWVLLQSQSHSFAWEGVISAYSDFSFSIEMLGRFPGKIIINFQIIHHHLLRI